MQPYFSIHAPIQIPLYFQKQGFFSLKCGQCALNNLLGAAYFNSDGLNQICYSLSDSKINNPYKSVFGGDYDVTVLINALKQYNIQLRWLKKQEKVKDLLNMQTVKGFMLNIRQSTPGAHVRRILGQSGRHWITIKRNQKRDNFIILDSIMDQPYHFKDLQETEQYFQNNRKQGTTILVAEYNSIKKEQPIQEQQQLC